MLLVLRSTPPGTGTSALVFYFRSVQRRRSYRTNVIDEIQRSDRGLGSRRELSELLLPCWSPAAAGDYNGGGGGSWLASIEIRSVEMRREEVSTQLDACAEETRLEACTESGTGLLDESRPARSSIEGNPRLAFCCIPRLALLGVGGTADGSWDGLPRTHCGSHACMGDVGV